MTRRSLLKNALLSGICGMNLPAPQPTAPEGYTFLFQGDSITDGNRSRDQDWNHVLGHGYVYLIASRLWYDHPDRQWQFINRGISGNKVTDLAMRWQQDTIDLIPQLLTILIGVNDVASMFTRENVVTPDVFREVYGGLLDRTRQQLPGTRIVLCEPFLLPVGKVKDNWEDWAAEMNRRQQIVRELALKFNALFIPLQEEFNKACRKARPDHWIWDGIHPMPGGHELIARMWLREMKKNSINDSDV